MIATKNPPPYKCNMNNMLLLYILPKTWYCQTFVWFSSSDGWEVWLFQFLSCISLMIMKFEPLFMLIKHSSSLFLKLSSCATFFIFSWIALPLFYWFAWLIYISRHLIFAGYIQSWNLSKAVACILTLWMVFLIQW